MAVTAYLTRAQAVQIIEGKNGLLFSCQFTKRTTGETRRMTARLGVRSHLRGGNKGYDAAAKRLLTVFDIHANGYRSIPIDGIDFLLVDGRWLPVVDAAPTAPCCSFPVPDELGGCDTCGRCW
jgi:hypothetical protein